MSMPKTKGGSTRTKVCCAHTHQEQEGVTGTPGEHRNMPTYMTFKSQKCLWAMYMGTSSTAVLECCGCSQVDPSYVHVQTMRRTQNTFFQLLLLLHKTIPTKYTEWHFISERGLKPHSSNMSCATEQG